jgi:hypothetical protein
VSSGETRITESYNFVNSGSKSVNLEVISDSETRSYTGSFETLEDLPPITIDFPDLSDGDSVSSSNLDTKVKFDSSQPFNYSIYADGRLLEEKQDQNSGEIPTNQQILCLGSGSHNIEAEAYGKDSEQTYSESVSFEVTGSPQMAYITTFESSTTASPLIPTYEIIACESLNFDVDIQQSGSVVENVAEGSLNKRGISEATTEDEVSLSSGSYTLNATAYNQNGVVERTHSFEVN